MTPKLADFPPVSPERDEYAVVLSALAPILDGQPPKIISNDGRANVGKTTLGRFLAWRFNTTLVETDLYLLPKPGRLVYQIATIKDIIQRFVGGGDGGKPVIVEGIVALRIIREAGFTSDFNIRVICRAAVESHPIIDAEWSKYIEQF